jgi:uncharacterized protein YjbI with pentapeptide repeats
VGGNELMSYTNPDEIIDKPAVYLFQLESTNDDSASYYDSDVKGVDIAKINFLEKYRYSFRIGNIDSLQVQLFDPNNNEIFNINTPDGNASFITGSGTYTLKLTNLRQSKGVRRIFYKPDYDTIKTFNVFNANDDVIYSILSEDECVACNLESTNMSEFKLDSVNFTGANFQNANLRGADLSHSVLNYVNFLSVKADSSDMSYALFDKPEDLRHTTFNFVNARGISIRDAHLNFAKFYDCDLSYSIINNCVVDRADFFACNMKNADLRNNDFTNASFEYCRFDSSDVRGTNFCNSYLKNATFYQTVGDKTTECVPDSVSGIN